MDASGLRESRKKHLNLLTALTRGELQLNLYRRHNYRTLHFLPHGSKPSCVTSECGVFFMIILCICDVKGFCVIKQRDDSCSLPESTEQMLLNKHIDYCVYCGVQGVAKLSQAGTC